MPEPRQWRISSPELRNYWQHHMEERSAGRPYPDPFVSGGDIYGDIPPDAIKVLEDAMWQIDKNEQIPPGDTLERMKHWKRMDFDKGSGYNRGDREPMPTKTPAPTPDPDINDALILEAIRLAGGEG